MNFVPVIFAKLKFKRGTDNLNIVGKTVVSWHSSQGPDSYLISLR